jgi:hypothetical protein
MSRRAVVVIRPALFIISPSVPYHPVWHRARCPLIGTNLLHDRVIVRQCSSSGSGRLGETFAQRCSFLPSDFLEIDR